MYRYTFPQRGRQGEGGALRYFEVALVVAHETGQRIGAIRTLRWSDIDLENDQVRWRAESEKTGYEHVTPLTAETRWALEQARKHNPGIGETPILSSPKNPSEPMSRHLARDYWNRGVKLAGLAPKKGRTTRARVERRIDVDQEEACYFNQKEHFYCIS